MLGITFLYFTVDPNKLKPIIAQEVKKKTGYDVVIQGNLAWSFYPSLAVKVYRVMLSDPGELKPFVDLQNVKIAIEIMELFNHKETLQGQIRIASVKFKNLQAQNVSAKLLWQNDGFILQAIQAYLYGGAMEGAVQGNSLSVMPHWDWDVQLSQVQLKPLFEALYGVNTKIKMSGMGQIKLHVVSQGKTRNQILNQLNGAAEFNISNGAVEGMDFNYYVQAAEALMSQEPQNSMNETNQTTFNQLAGVAIIKNGIVNSRNLLLVSPRFITRGEGSVVLSSQDMDVELKIEPQQNAKISWKIPLVITGNVNSPNIRLDGGEIQKLIVKREIDKIKDKARDQIKKHIPGNTAEFLQKLLSD